MVYHLPGYRFSPTDDELVMFYLKRKIMGKKLLTRPIAEVDIYNYHPRDLPGKSSSTTNDLVWYFFCPSHIQNTSSRRRSRATDGGFWKTTGVDKPVYHDSRIVGKRKSLVFHNGRAPKAERTDWVIHEFRLEDPLADPNFSQNSYVICKLFEKSGPGPKIAEKHGAPFKEEDWDDDDNVGIDNNSADLISSVSSSERHHDRDRDHDLQSSFHPKDSINIGNNQNSLNSFQFGPQEPPAVLGIERTLFHIDSEIPVPILSQEPDQLNQSSLQNPAFDLMDSQTEGGNQYTPNGFCGPVELSNYLNTSRSLLYTDSALPVPVLYPELQNNHSSLQNPSFYPMDSNDEVKVEEEMRLNHKKKRMRLERLDEKGAETHKIDSTRSIMMKLSTKIRIAIQVVDSISNRINKLRDEELWPELHELIEGLFRMWQVMAECHRSQIKAVIESNNLDNAVYSLVGKASDEHEKAIMGLVMDMLNWIEFFSSWISAQKNYVRSLNEWLRKCLPNEEEETADGIAPFSPGRLGAPPVFVICNHWLQAIDRISETEVLEAMQSFTSTVMKIWRLHYTKSRASEDDKKLKALEKVDQKIHKAVAALNKKRTHSAIENQTPSPGEIIHLNLSDEPVSLKADLQKIFEAMERFSKNSLDAYEELSNRCDEESSKARETIS